MHKLTQWAVAFFLGASSTKGFTALQLHRILGCQYNTAWFLHHRVMEAMRRGGLEVPLGGSGAIVEADETYLGWVDKPRPRPKSYPKLYKGGRAGPANKRAIIALVERGGNVRSFHVPRADTDTVTRIVNENIARETTLYTDESKLYKRGGATLKGHETVKHSLKEYVRYTESGKIHTNTIEGYFSIFKRGMRGNYQHCAEKNLHRYLAEFDFRYNTRDMSDAERAALAVKSGEGKRLTYHQSVQAWFQIPGRAVSSLAGQAV